MKRINASSSVEEIKEFIQQAFQDSEQGAWRRINRFLEHASEVAYYVPTKGHSYIIQAGLERAYRDFTELQSPFNSMEYMRGWLLLVDQIKDLDYDEETEIYSKLVCTFEIFTQIEIMSQALEVSMKHEIDIRETYIKWKENPNLEDEYINFINYLYHQFTVYPGIKLVTGKQYMAYRLFNYIQSRNFPAKDLVLVYHALKKIKILSFNYKTNKKDFFEYAKRFFGLQSSSAESVFIGFRDFKPSGKLNSRLIDDLAKDFQQFIDNQ